MSDKSVLLPRLGWTELYSICELILAQQLAACMQSYFLVITLIRAKYSVGKDSAPRPLITIGMALVFVFLIRDNSGARS